MLSNAPATYLFGIGNSGRQDDGLGWAVLDVLEADAENKCTLFHRYQLQVEDAELITNADQVVFIDAHHGPLEDGYSFERLSPSGDFEFTTHVLPPQAVLHLAGDLYGKQPEAWLLLIEGSAWELQSGLTEAGKARLQEALRVLKRSLGLE